MAWQFATLEIRSQETGPSELLLFIIARGRYVSGQVVRASSPRRIRRRPRRPEKTLYGEARSVALHLCPPLQFGPLTYQPTECVFISSNQSVLWSCLLHVTSQLWEGCSTSLFASFSWSCGRLAYETVLERFPRWGFGEFYRSLKYVLNFPRSTYMFICWRARKPGTRMKAKASKKDSSKKIRYYICSSFKRLFYVRIRVMVQISSS